MQRLHHAGRARVAHAVEHGLGLATTLGIRQPSLSQPPPITPEDVGPAAELLRALASPQRLAIVCTQIEGERAVSELEALGRGPWA